ncbi:hypothetical protein [Vibrio phage vB_VpM-pA2SJ1]|uniref:Uncharacterized protein n=1 Tax=Vibrio phage vB_VpM-pA2SJ1 TaxID=3095964 RepID=A0AAX4J593_9CAUD
MSEASVFSGSGVMSIESDIQKLVKDRKFVKIEMFGKDLIYCVIELTNGAVVSGRPCICEAGQHSESVIQAIATNNALEDVRLCESYREEVARQQ